MKKKKYNSIMKICRRGIGNILVAYSSAGVLKMPLKNLVLISFILFIHMKSQTQVLAVNASVPQVLSVNPISNSVSASPATTMVVTFASAINPSSVSESTFLVYGNITGKHQGSILVDNNNQRITFTPQKAFAFGENVQAILTAGIYFFDGTQLANGYSWEYRVKTQMGSGQFVAVPELLQSSGGPCAISAGDLNSDGFPDIAVVNSSGNSVSVYLNNSHGSFLSPRSYPSGTSPKALCVGDLDGDGSLDLVVANSGSSTVSVFMNDGKASFGSPVNYAVGANPVTIKVEDINNDGKLDLIVGNSGDSTMSILKNDGSGVFLSSQTIPLGAAPSDIALGDLDNNGTVDAVTCNGLASTITLLKNTGGIFTVDTTCSVPYYGSKTMLNSIAVFDFDKDGFPDVAVANGQSYEVSIFLNDKKGRVTIGQFVIGIGTQRTTLALYGNDLDSDGDIDLAVGSYNSKNVTVLLNNGMATPTISTDTTWNSPQGIVGLDMSGRFGVIDLVTANPATNNLTLLRNQITVRPSGSITLSSSTINFDETAVGDTARMTLRVYSDLISNTIDSIRFSSPLFISEGTFTRNINAYDSTAFEILFSPKSFGIVAASLNIYTSDGMRSVTLNGASPAPVLLSSTSLLDFGTVKIGQTGTQTLKITNTSVNILRIDSLVLKWKGFALPNIIIPISIRKGDTLQLPIAFSPTILQEYRDTLRVYSNSSPSDLEIALRGSAAAVGVIHNDSDQIVPKKYSLDQNYPNPFNPQTVISYQLSMTSNVTLKVYDISGREIAILVDGVQNQGVYTVKWSAQDLSSGVYFYTLTARPRVGEANRIFTMTKKLLIIR